MQSIKDNNKPVNINSMKKKYNALMARCFLIVLLFVHCSAFAVEIPNNLFMSVLVTDMTSGEIVYELNPDLNVIPASTHKILTAYIAATKLGWDFQYKTKFGIHAHNANESDLYIKFVGDPTLTYSDLEVAILQVIQAKPNAHFAKIVIDDTIFDREYYARGSFMDNAKFCFASPISAIVIDRNCSKFFLNRKESSTYRTDSNFQPIKLNCGKTYKADGAKCQLDLISHDKNQYDLYGCYEKELPGILSLAINDPRNAAMTAIKQILHDNNIKHTSITFGHFAPNAKVVHTYVSPTLDVMIHRMLKVSDNLIADTLAKTVAYNQVGGPASWFDVQNTYEGFFRKLLPSESRHVIFLDGSGLSGKNFTNARFMNALLGVIYNDPNTSARFLKALPQPKGEGTLLNRFQNSKLSVQGIYAKTGTLDSTSALSGYILDDDRALAFSIYINHTTGSLKDAKLLEEEVLEAVLHGTEE